jgi:parallel beta-helix repeat protein
VALQDCIVTANIRDGILTRNSGGDHTIEGCILSHNGAYAVNAHQFSRSIIRDCDVFGNAAGLRVGWGWHIVVEGNRVYRNGSPGIYPDSCYYSTFAGNLVYANEGLGIKLGYISSRNIIRENIILDHDEGIWVGLEWGSYSRNRIYHNDVLRNQAQVIEARAGLVGFQEWDNGPLSGGNFWSDYAGQDRDGDGIGDTAHVILPGAIDQFPLMRSRNSIRAKVTIDPEQGKSEGRNGWLEVHVALPAGLPIEDIDRATLRLNDAVAADRRRSSVVDHDADGVPELKVLFRWRQVEAALHPGDSRTVSVSGKLSSGLRFIGSAALDLNGR